MLVLVHCSMLAPTYCKAHSIAIQYTVCSTCAKVRYGTRGTRIYGTVVIYRLIMYNRLRTRIVTGNMPCSSAGLPTSPPFEAAPTSGMALRYALLFRGQSMHWGCSAESAFLQRLCILSHHAMISRPLEAQGHCVDVYVALNPASSACVGSAHHVDVADTSLHGGRRVIVEDVRRWSRSQSANFRYAINSVFRAAYQQAAGTRAYDYLIISRYDMRLLQPILPTWTCHADPVLRGKLGIASRCGTVSYAKWRCTFDTLFIVPRAHIAAFNRSIGSADKPGSRTFACCFNEMCMAGGVKATGQACYNVFARRLEGGSNSIAFCFPPSGFGGNQAPNGPDYQCCSRGLTNWSKVYNAEVKRDPSALLSANHPSNGSFGQETLADKYRALGPL